MSRLSSVLFALVVLVLLACGGGGSAGPLGLTYSTDWSHRFTAGQITGLSQRVNILDSAGLAVTTVILQNTASSGDATNLTLPDGTYTLQVQLYSGVNASGTQTGVIEVPFTITGGHGPIIKSSVGDAINAITVSPDQKSVQVGRGAEFKAAGVNNAGVKTFLAPNSITWSVLGGIGTVTPDGNFTATAIGTGSVRATYLISQTGAAAVTGTPPVATHTKWTVLVYMNSANDLQQFSLLNMNQMERVADNPDVRFVVQWKQYAAISASATFNGTRRYLAKPDTTGNIVSEMLQDMGTSVDMGSTLTLHDFIGWGKANFPADHYCLILWDHGSGWQRSLADGGQAQHHSISYDAQMDSDIQIWDLNQALGSEHFDILACDACDMQMMEVAYEVKDNCDFYAGSEEITPGEGYPYHLVFGPLRDNPNLTPKNFSKSFVDGMLGVPLYSTSKITQSVIDTSKLPALATAISTLGTELKNNSVSLTSAIQQTRSDAQAFDVSTTRCYLDIKDLCTNLESHTAISSVLTATAAVKLAIADAVVWEGHNTHSPNSSGLSIDFSAGSLFATKASDYQLLKLAQATQWDEFLAAAP